MIIKLIENEINNYLEIDQNIFKFNSEDSYKDEPIYILHFPKGDKASVSYGKGFEKINEFDIKHLCSTDSGSSGGPILSKTTNKVIGIHKGAIPKRNYNIGTFLKFPLNQINLLNKKNEIILKVKIDENDINKKIYFLDNTFYYANPHSYFRELNEFNAELYIDNKKRKFMKYFIPEKEGIYSIMLKFNISIKDCSYMFFDIIHLINIDIRNFDTSNVSNMKEMFCDCISLKSISGISNLDTKNVTDISGMFWLCKSLISLPDISSWNTKNVTDVSSMFYDCISLKSLPDISSWNTTNVTNMRDMFNYCSSLISLPDISKWDIKNVTDMSHMFYYCSSLISLPDISKWNTKNVKNMRSIWCHCHSLISLPDISNWNTQNLTDMDCMLHSCYLIKSLPDISRWNTQNVKYISYMFSFCRSLNSIPDISKWEINKVYMRSVFHGCNSLKSIPDISHWNINQSTKSNECLII